MLTHTQSSFSTHPSLTRSLSLSTIQVAQGRVWTGRQALNVGLVDHIGGLNKALKIAASLCDLPQVGTRGYSSGYKVQTFVEPRGGLPFTSATSGVSTNILGTDIQAICDDSVACSGLVSSESLGISPIFQALGLNQLFAYNVAHTAVGGALLKSVQSLLSGGSQSTKNMITEFLEDFF